MPRKKEVKTGFHLKVVPSGRLDDLKKIAKKYPHIQDEHVALCKYLQTFSYVVEMCWNRDKEFVPVSQKILRKKLHIESGESRILSDLVKHKFLVIDKSTFEFGEHSWEYKPIYKALDNIMLFRKYLNKKTDQMMYDEILYEGDMKLYYDTICKLKFDNDVCKHMNDIISNTDIYDKVILTNITNSIQYIYDASFVPTEKSEICEYASSVPYAILGKIPTQFIPVFKLMQGRFRLSRPVKNSRVYSNITNLQRDYRQFLRLNGKPLIGFDIKNCQLLIASIPFRKYSEQTYGEIKPDVLEFQRSCELGIGYEYFMELNKIDTTCDVMRTEFKKRFFGKVFYTMVTEADNPLKAQFKEKYPTCFEAMNAMKGGLFSKQYKDFPALMTEIETYIMFNTNIELIKQGYDVVNIFDSLYSDSEESIALAKQMVTQKFAKLGVTPAFKDISYRQESIPDLQDTQNKTIMKQSNKKSKPAVESVNQSQHIQHTLTDGTVIWNQQYFVDYYKMDDEFASECYYNQFNVDFMRAKNNQEYKALKKRQNELEVLFKKSNYVDSVFE